MSDDENKVIEGETIYVLDKELGVQVLLNGLATRDTLSSLPRLIKVICYQNVF